MIKVMEAQMSALHSETADKIIFLAFGNSNYCATFNVLLI